jgi:hypothetical protein
MISNTTSSVEGHQILAENNLTELFSCVILSAVFGRRKPTLLFSLKLPARLGFTRRNVHMSETALHGICSERGNRIMARP